MMCALCACCARAVRAARTTAVEVVRYSRWARPKRGFGKTLSNRFLRGGDTRAAADRGACSRQLGAREASEQGLPAAQRASAAAVGRGTTGGPAAAALNPPLASAT